MKRFIYLLSVCLAVVTLGHTTCVKAQTPDMDPLIFEGCTQMYIEQLKKEGREEEKARTMAGLLCQIIAGDCQAKPRGGRCMNFIRELNGELEDLGQSFSFMAAYAGRQDLIERLIKVGADIDKPVSNLAGSPSGYLGDGWTPLMIAAAEGHAGVVSKLIKAGATVNAQNSVGRTPLMFASISGFTPIVKELLTHGADPNIVPDDESGWTALIAAAQKGHIDTVRVLLKHGADATITDKEGNTALMSAEAQGHADIADVLRDATEKK